MKRFKTQVILSFIFSVVPILGDCQNPTDYLEVIKKEGDEPVQFIQQRLKTYDLILFDDGLHSAYEPFEFYQQLINTPETKLDYIFLEVFGINLQPGIDAFMNSASKDTLLLLKVFQNDFSGFGWRYETYLDLLSTVWEYNHNQSDEKAKIKVIGVDQPVYWEGLHTRQDYDIFLQSLEARDYFMYNIISKYLDYFKSGKKGIFLSNTRHIYKNIKDKEGKLYWNCGTFFHQWHPQTTFAVRIHNAMLSFEDVKAEKESVTAEGLDNVKYSWVKPDNGIWEKAFELNKNLPVAIPFKNNPFGRAKYIGNHMLDVEAGQTMYDAYDALVFLAPLDSLHFSAKMNFFYTDEFKEELKRRIKIVYSENTAAFLDENNVTSIDNFIDNFTKYYPGTGNELLDE